MKQLLVLTVLIVLAAQVLIACAPSPTPVPPAATSVPQAPKPLKLGFVQALSGPGGVFADFVNQGVELALKEVKEGNIAGREIILITGDDATDPKVANDVCTRLISAERVDVLMAFQSSANRAACLPLAERAGIPYIYTAGTEPGISSKSWIATAEALPQSAAPLLDYMMQAQGSKSFYLLGNDYIAPRTALEFGRKYIEGKGGKVLAEEYVPLGTSEYTAVIAKIVQSGADTLYQYTIGPDQVALVKQLRATSGAQNLKIASGALDPGTYQGIGAQAKGIVTAFSYFDSIGTPENAKFKAALKALFADKTLPASVGQALPYDSIHLLARAVQKANSTEASALLSALREVSFKGPRGEIKIGKDGYAVLPMYVATAGGDGTYTIVKETAAVDMNSLPK